MSKASTVAKNKYAAKTYDRLSVVVPKGQKLEIQSYASAQGLSLNSYVVNLIEKDMQSVKGAGFSLTRSKIPEE